MFQKFYQYSHQKGYWQADARVLVAVSGGVDSMVLLDLMQKAAKKDSIQLAVAHVNHGLRKESDQEAAYLESYCNQRQLPFFYKKWNETNKQVNTEARARQFRYAFFEEIMTTFEYSILMTAHHGDDQAETFLMKVLRGSSFQALAGIRSIRPLTTGRVVRPFLIFSKEELETFAKKAKIVYFEDATNFSNDYLRNRLRHQVVPQLKQENVKVLQHIQAISEQVQLVESGLEQLLLPKYTQWVAPTKGGWTVALTELATETESVQTLFLHYFFQQTLLPKGVQINKSQVNQILASINSNLPQQEISLEKGWFFLKEYQCASVVTSTNMEVEAVFQLSVGEQVFLSEGEWLALESFSQPIKQPAIIAGWQQETLDVTDTIQLPLTIRHRQRGDRISLTDTLTKRVNRMFIDQKIPNSQRDQAWLVVTKDEKVIWIPKFANSYLSIPKETDKILYRLIYKTNH